MTRASVADLTALVRQYQTANTREEMAAADAKALALVGPAPVAEAPKRKPRR